VVGRRDRLDPRLVAAIEAAEVTTRGGNALHLRIAIDYSARDAIVTAAGRPSGADRPTRESFARALAAAMHVAAPLPDVDLLIRTGGERRLSDFLLWECAYAELLFLDCAWPDFGADELGAAIREFSHRDRRYGGLSTPKPAPTMNGSRPRSLI
jgi:undecaprenyl diphosphate synthase